MNVNTLMSIALTLLSLHTALYGNTKEAAVSHKTRQTRPIQLGVSGGSIVDKSNGYCCSGTLGSLVKDTDGTQYILSNTHVFAGDSVPGGNGKVARVGDPINQPGYVDVSCQNKAADYVATLYDWADLVPDGLSTVDAAIAKVTSGKVDPKGKILEIGTISSSTLGAFLNQRVKKSGRTSGLTRGTIAALHATVTVQYTDECAGNSFITTLKEQILITPGTFIRAGDSGSLMVEDRATNPKAIGLLYAGSSSIAVANPIQAFLDIFSVSMLGIETPEDEEPSQSQKRLERAMQKVAAVKEEHEALLMSVEGAVGHAVGLSQEDHKTPVILLLVKKASSAVALQAPKTIGPYKVEIIEVGTIKAV